ncbi:MAG: tRNA (adenosine(37)-N6)-threonylcarbamoyltransferase complex transferase subunit TsaD, partial [Patescibacteria group bacterium]|nr:tRNA (adenosine(37)-N6)-threonylcarbamoyltransferase complex transferase subunit TsaD [Patescibacteria group bacterium]
IETSCDETSLAKIKAEWPAYFKNPKTLTLPIFKIIKNLILSQIKIHSHFGGVVPNLAKREHQKNLPILFKKLSGENIDSNSQKIKKFLKDIDLITITVGPGLEPALWSGIEFTKKIIKKYKELNIKSPKIIGANHLLGHLYSFMLDSKITSKKIKNQTQIFPSIALIVSGGHTILINFKSLFEYKKLGETRDDACGEAFDKVARMLDLKYPGGPQIEKLAKAGNPKEIIFPRPMIYDKSYDFSFSGLKTSVFYYLRDSKKVKDEKFKADVAASFQEAAFDVLIYKSTRAIKEFKAKSVMISGGVAANKTLRKKFYKLSKLQKILFFVPPFIYNTDNAVIIGISAYFNFLNKKFKKLKAIGDLNI